MMLTLLLVIVLAVVFVGMLLHLVYRETEIDFPPRHCIYHHHARHS